MAQHSTIDNIQRALALLKLMSREEGATVTEMSRATGINRWTVRDMIDQLDSLAPDGKGLCIEELESDQDKRAVRFHVPRESLWSITIPGMSLTDEEALLLALIFEQGRSNAVLKEYVDGLQKKICMFNNVRNYEIINVESVKKQATAQTREILMMVMDAVENGKCLEFEYRPVRRDPKTYRVVPLGVFKYDTGYYLSAQKVPSGEYRTFGIERIIGIPALFEYEGEPVQKFDFESLFEDPFGPFDHGDEFEAVLKFDSFYGFYNLEKAWPDSVKVYEQEDKSVIMKAKTHSCNGIKQYILGFGSGVEVLEPQWLREYVRDAHLSAAGLYC